MDGAQTARVDTSRPFVLTIGTSEPWISAGLLLDLYLADRLRIRPLAVVTAVSAQDGAGIFAVTPLPIEAVAAQFAAIESSDIRAVRVGAIIDPAVFRLIRTLVEERRIPLVLDPVLATSSGFRFGGPDLSSRLISSVLPCATLITPNLSEAEELTGRPVKSELDMVAAAVELRALGAQAALIKGGHLNDAATDVLASAAGIEKFTAERLAVTMRGTGCTLAIAITAALAYGVPLREAIIEGRAFTLAQMRSAKALARMRIAR